MLSANPIDRPPADEIQHRVYQILTQNAGITEPHCVHRYGGWDLGFNHLRISSPTPGRDSESFSGRRLGHSRTNSSGALSENSQASSSASSDRGGQETELGSSAGSMSVSGSGFAALRNIRVPQEE
ncbi:hypothetical protein HYQ45_008973 [Verticillium longisporum]|uniref:Uncharacterized protein n=1 Tax=Verticillium longisporum TaxID=100787 RepID=A0A8I3AQD0_VERLO|nr:hypothetical protein HYQ45_008973 [Verticillium longisporum]